MTARINWRRAGTLICPAIVLLAAAGCNTTRSDVAALDTRSGAPLDTGAYPNLNVARPAAATQFTDEERDAKIASLKAAGARTSRSRGGAAPKPDGDMVRLGQNRGEDVLKEIEAR